MGKRLINVDEVEEIVPVLVGKLLENNLITTVGYLAYMDDKSIILGRGESKLQVYMTISNGTNGAEGCIINPMEDVLNVLKDLRKCKGVTWSQLLEVGIDNADDLYWWYVTFSIDTTAI